MLGCDFIDTLKEDRWIGVSEERFKQYKNWRTPSGYLCGTYAASVLLAYYQDFIDETTIPPHIRKKNSQRSTVLADFLRIFIQPHGLPTVPPQVSFGLNKFFKHFSLPFSARFTPLGSWQRATKRIREGKPVIVGTLAILGSTYGNHWVVAYAYQETASGDRYYKIHDNWGNYDKIIPVNWTNGTISFP